MVLGGVLSYTNWTGPLPHHRLCVGQIDISAPVQSSGGGVTLKFDRSPATAASQEHGRWVGWFLEQCHLHTTRNMRTLVLSPVFLANI